MALLALSGGGRASPCSLSGTTGRAGRSLMIMPSTKLGDGQLSTEVKKTCCRWNCASNACAHQNLQRARAATRDSTLPDVMGNKRLHP
eukprot:10533237-Alexandrium_andersonii.AAC.1